MQKFIVQDGPQKHNRNKYLTVLRWKATTIPSGDTKVDMSYLTNHVNFLHTKSWFSQDDSFNIRAEPLIPDSINTLKLGIDDMDIDKLDLNLDFS